MPTPENPNTPSQEEKLPSPVSRWVKLGSHRPPSREPQSGWNELAASIPDVNPELSIIGYRHAALASFRTQFSQAEKFVKALDDNPDEAIRDPAVRIFVSQLATSGFRILAIHGWRGLSADSLPVWLQNTFLSKNQFLNNPDLNDISQKRAQKLFEDLVHGVRFEIGRHGTYYSVGREPVHAHAPAAQRFKCYLEGEALLRALTEKSVQPFFSALNDANCGLWEVKLFESARLVMYFNSSIEQSAPVLKLAKDFSLNLRGPAQDVEQFIVTKDGVLETEGFTSNDGALGHDNKFRLTSAVYNRPIFLRDYYNFCLFAGKRPDKPYETSFVYLTRKGEPPSPNEAALVKEAEVIAGYPVIAVERRLAFVERLVGKS